MDRLPVIIVGGDKRNLTGVRRVLECTQFESSTRKLSQHVCPRARAIVVLTRFVSRSLFKEARDLAKFRSIPLVQASTGDYILPELVRYGILHETDIRESNRIDEEELEAPIEEKKVAVMEAPKEEQGEIGLSVEEMVEKYKPIVIEFVQKYMEPGDRLTLDDLLELMAEEVGLPRKDLLVVLPEVVSTGVLAQVDEHAWVRPDEAFDYEEEAEKAKRKRAKKAPPKGAPPTHIVVLARLVRGLPKGPYPKKSDLAEEIRSHDFRKADGEPISRTYPYLIIKKAVELKYVEQTDDGWIVHTDASVAVERLKDTPFVPKEQPPKPTDKYVSLGSLGKEPQGKSTPLSTSRIKQKLGIIRLSEAPPATFRDMFPLDFWDECAVREIRIRLSQKGLKGIVLSRDAFAVREWDVLAWMHLREKKVAEIVDVFRPRASRATFADKILWCRVCEKEWTFTAGEQRAFLEYFGEVKSPSSCPACRRRRKEGM
jgi:hypothetical protein